MGSRQWDTAGYSAVSDISGWVVYIHVPQSRSCPFSVLFVWQMGHPAYKKLGVGLLMVIIWPGPKLQKILSPEFTITLQQSYDSRLRNSVLALRVCDCCMYLYACYVTTYFGDCYYQSYSDDNTAQPGCSISTARQARSCWYYRRICIQAAT